MTVWSSKALAKVKSAIRKMQSMESIIVRTTMSALKLFHISLLKSVNWKFLKFESFPNIRFFILLFNFYSWLLLERINQNNGNAFSTKQEKSIMISYSNFKAYVEVLIFCNLYFGTILSARSMRALIHLAFYHHHYQCHHHHSPFSSIS